ncbi:hypothetical protein TH53_24935, partial [Pedobacter lusitanus]
NFTGGSDFNFGGGTQGINILASINPSDVQSVEILKDAAAYLVLPGINNDVSDSSSDTCQYGAFLYNCHNRSDWCYNIGEKVFWNYSYKCINKKLLKAYSAVIRMELNFVCIASEPCLNDV